MPADYEMIVAASPPVFSHSPPASTFLNYNYLRYGTLSNCRSKLCAESFARNPSTKIIMPPRRPCLVVRADELLHGKSKKRVVFADDRGLALTQVRVMNEPSTCPPLWTSEFLAQVTKGVSAEVAPEPWEVTFSQPASDYLEFRKRLDSENVSLENVIVKETNQIILGTVKVRNISFHKEVIVRATFDHWTTHEDAFCTFVPNNPVSFGGTTTTGYVLYDTFSFRLTLKPRARKVEFCVCFRCDGHEFWDNNNGKNYILLKSATAQIPNNKHAETLNDQPALQQQRFHDALRAKMDSWSEFASWNHLVNDAPYW